MGASLVAQRVKRLPAMQETWVRSLGQEDPLEKEMATHSSTLAWKIPRTEKPGRTRLSDITFTFFTLLWMGSLMQSCVQATRSVIVYRVTCPLLVVWIRD